MATYPGGRRHPKTKKEKGDKTEIVRLVREATHTMKRREMTNKSVPVLSSSLPKIRGLKLDLVGQEFRLLVQ